MKSSRVMLADIKLCNTGIVVFIAGGRRDNSVQVDVVLVVRQICGLSSGLGTERSRMISSYIKSLGQVITIDCVTHTHGR